MDHLYLMLTELYPNKDFLILEKFERITIKKKAKNLHIYELYIEDRASEKFKKFDDLENYVFELYKKECVIQAINIANGKEEK